MSRIFAERGIRADGNVLPFEEFRLFIDEKDPKFDEKKMARVVKRAEEMLEEPIPMLPASLYREFVVNGNRTHYQTPYFRRRLMALTLAMAEAYEKKGRFSEKLMDAVFAIFEESSWVIPAHLYNTPLYTEFGIPAVYGDRMHGIDLFAASTGAVLAAVYHFAGDALDKITPVITERLLYETHHRLIVPYLNCSFWWTGERGNSPNNWNPWIHSNLLLLTALTERDPYLRNRITGKCMQMLDNFVADYPADGGCDEGPSYFGVAGASYFDCLELLYDMTGGKVNVFDHPLVRAIGEYEVKFNIAGKRFINFADCGPICHMDGAMLSRFGRRTGSGILEEFGREQSYMGSVECDGQIYRCMYNYFTPVVTEKPERAAATKIWFPNLKVMAARENPDPTQGMFVAMKGGNNNESHNHNDIGNVIVYHDGNPVLIDTGAGTYTKKTFSAQRYELWYMQSSYHNLPDIGGVAEQNGANFRSSDEVYDEATGGVKMEIGGAYPKEAGILSYTRETVLADGVVTVTDTLSLTEEKEIDFHYMSPVKPTLDGNRIALAEGRTMTFDPRLAPEIEEFEVKDDGIERNWKSPLLWRIHLRTKAKEGSFTVTVK